MLFYEADASTGLLWEAPCDWRDTKAGATISIDQKKRVDLGVSRGADHDERVPEAPSSTVDGVCVEL